MFLTAQHCILKSFGGTGKSILGQFPPRMTAHHKIYSVFCDFPVESLVVPNMPTTAIKPFNEDIIRARDLVNHGRSLPSTGPAKELKGDVLRAAWMFAVGATDAYFCDAYTDIVAATLIAKSRTSGIELPPFLAQLKIPVIAVLEDYSSRHNWKWRMATREMMSKSNGLALETVATWFNPFLSDGKKLFGEVAVTWMDYPKATDRLFGHPKGSIQDTANLLKSAEKAFNDAKSAGNTSGLQSLNEKVNLYKDRLKRIKKDAARVISERIEEIFQRRHDCIHTCDRPKNKPQKISAGSVDNVIRDLEFIVKQTDHHLNKEFRNWLLAQGFSKATAAQVGYPPIAT